MSTLPDEEIKRIARKVATANNVSVASVLTAPVMDSTGSEAIKIRFILTRGSSGDIEGEPSARTVSHVIRELADKGEERFPIVRYEEQSAAPKS